MLYNVYRHVNGGIDGPQFIGFGPPPPWAVDVRCCDIHGNVEAAKSAQTEAELIAADLAWNKAKASYHERNDAQALQDQIMIMARLRSFG